MIKKNRIKFPISITLSKKALKAIKNIKTEAAFTSTSATIEEIIFAISQIIQNPKPEVVNTILWRFKKNQR